MLYNVDKTTLLKKYYYNNCFVQYAGAIFNYTNNTDKPSIFEKNSKESKKPNFNLDLELNKHVVSDINLAGIMKKHKVDFMAWDLDADTHEEGDLRDSVKNMLAFLHQEGFKTFTYLSGGKGFHIEIKLAEPIEFHRLNRISNTIKTVVKAKGIRFIDRTYPCGSRYRLFGCLHYKTKKFTSAVNETDLTPLSEDASWLMLQNYLHNDVPANTVSLIHNITNEYSSISSTIISKNTPSIKHAKKSIITKKDSNASNELLHIYKYGLSTDYRDKTGNGRYLTSYQLGRLFRFVLHYDEETARIEIDLWLRRHYKDHCDTGQYLGPEAESCISSTYEQCRSQTISNCLNAYSNSTKPFGKQQYSINIQKTKRYLIKNYSNDKVLKAMIYLIKQCNRFASLSLYHSYNQLKEGWGVGSSRTVKKILDNLYELKLIKRLKEGNPIDKHSSLYLINLPPDCYQIMSPHLS